MTYLIKMEGCFYKRPEELDEKEFQKIQKFQFIPLFNIIEPQMISVHFLRQLESSGFTRKLIYLMLNIINYWPYNLQKGLFTNYTQQDRTLVVDGIEEYVKNYIKALQCVQFKLRQQGNTKLLFKIDEEQIIVNAMPELGIIQQVFQNYKPIFKIECLEYCEYSLDSILSAYKNVMVYYINGKQDILTKAKIKILTFNLLHQEIKKSAISNFNFTSQKNLSERMILSAIKVKFNEPDITTKPFIQYKKESDLQQEVENFYIYDALKVSENQQQMGRRKSCDKDVGHKNVGGVQQIAMDLHSSNNYTYDILKKVAPLNSSPSQTQLSISHTQVSALSLYNNQSPSSSDSRSFTSYGLMNAPYIFDIAQISPYPPDLHLRSRNSHQQQQQRVSRSKSNSITCDIFAELKLKPEPQEKKYKKKRN